LKLWTIIAGSRVFCDVLRVFDVKVEKYVRRIAGSCKNARQNLFCYGNRDAATIKSLIKINFAVFRLSAKEKFRASESVRVKRMRWLMTYLFVFLALFCGSLDIQAAPGNTPVDTLAAVQQNPNEDREASEIIRRADRIRAPDQPFRYSLTLVEMKGEQEVSRQVLDVAMRFYKPTERQAGDARALVRFVAPASERGKSLLSVYDKLWYYEPKLRRPIPISLQQRLVGQVSNGDVVAADFDFSYFSKLSGIDDCDGRKCYRMELTRRWPYVTYPKINYWVEVESSRPFKTEFLSSSDKVLKRAWYKDYNFAVGLQRPHEIYIEDSLRKEQYTRMLYSDVRLEAVPEAYFQKEYLLRLR
jgi:hypothetical protein